jgi:hypothetical protein
MILMDQVDLPETGVVTARLLEAVGCIVRELPQLLIIADSRRTLRGWPPVCLKMNAAELASLTGAKHDLAIEEIKQTAAGLARQHKRDVFVTLSEKGIVGASPYSEPAQVPRCRCAGK